MRNQDQINSLKKKIKGYLSFIEFNKSKISDLPRNSSEASMLQNEIERFNKRIDCLEGEIRKFESGWN